MLRYIRFLSMLMIVVAVIAWVTPAPAAGSSAPAPLAAAQGARLRLDLPLAQATAQPAAMTLGLAVHSDPAVDAFWSVVVNGFKDATTLYGVTAKFGGNSDPRQQSQLIQNYVASKVDGIVVSMANPDALKDAIKQATDAGIPVITINSGSAQSKTFGALAHVGQTERVAGQGAGDKFTAAAVKNVLCVVHEEANIGLEERCAGLKDNFKGGTVANFSVASTGVKDVKGTLTALQNKLTADKTIDAVLTLNPTIAVAARDAIKASGSTAKLATFDLSSDVIDAINGGDMLFAIDQQQYLQGYLPVTMLVLYKRNSNTIGGGLPVLTGPGFVDKSNATQVKALTAKGTR